MSLSVFLPARLRVGVRSLWNDVRALRAIGELKPVYTTRHTVEELKALSRAAAEERDARLQQGHVEAQGSALRARLRRLTVDEVRRPTADAVTLVFNNPGDDPITFTPGQFLTLVVEIEGDEVRRAYSICSDPADSAQVAVTVKRVKGGLVSNWINDHVKAGDVITTLGPSGVFGTAPDPERSRAVILVGGGSGITPLMSIMRAIIRAEPESAVRLVYANRSVNTIIFREPIAEMERASKGRLDVTHVLETPPEDWSGLVGLLLGGVLEEAVPVDVEAEYYICGPGPMMDAVTHYLSQVGVPDAQINLERFSAQLRPDQAGSLGLVHSVRFARSNMMLQIADDQTLLEAGRAAGIPMEFSCTMGGCAACKVRVIEGDVSHDEPNCLTTSEKARGECLACVARPRSALVLDL